MTHENDSDVSFARLDILDPDKLDLVRPVVPCDQHMPRRSATLQASALGSRIAVHAQHTFSQPADSLDADGVGRVRPHPVAKAAVLALSALQACVVVSSHPVLRSSELLARRPKGSPIVKRDVRLTANRSTPFSVSTTK